MSGNNGNKIPSGGKGCENHIVEEFDTGYETPTDQDVKMPKNITWAPVRPKKENEFKQTFSKK